MTIILGILTLVVIIIALFKFSLKHKCGNKKVQVGPTCGIYALLNGLNYKKKRVTNIHKTAYEIYYKYKFKPNEHKKECYEGPFEENEVPLTYVGEFFSVEKFERFVNSIDVNISNDTNIRKVINKVSIEKIDYLDECSFVNEFILMLIPIKFVIGGKDETPHWIAIVDKNGKKYSILDSSGGYTGLSLKVKKCIDKNSLTDGFNHIKEIKPYDWTKFKRKKIVTTVETFLKNPSRYTVKLNREINRNLKYKRKIKGPETKNIGRENTFIGKMGKEEPICVSKDYALITIKLFKQEVE